MNATDWATFWAFAALVIFLGLIVYLKVPGMITAALDKRADDIRKQLAEATQLREEAQALLAEYQRKRKEAEADAAAILASAKREAAMLSAEAKRKTEDYVTRRNQLSEAKIKQAETDAVNAVRAAAVDLAIAAAQKIAGEKATGATGSKLFEDAVEQVRTRLN
jgi:F-type H+-transporting ATPase subunit b